MSDEPFGKMLKRLRLRAGLGLRQYAGICGIIPSRLYDIENQREIAAAEEVDKLAGSFFMLFEGTEHEDFRRASLQQQIVIQNSADMVPVFMRTADGKPLTHEQLGALTEFLAKTTPRDKPTWIVLRGGTRAGERYVVPRLDPVITFQLKSWGSANTIPYEYYQRTSKQDGNGDWVYRYNRTGN